MYAAKHTRISNPTHTVQPLSLKLADIHPPLLTGSIGGAWKIKIHGTLGGAKHTEKPMAGLPCRGRLLAS